jgi:hypothetical protein
MFAAYLKENEEYKRRNLKEWLEKEKRRLGELKQKRDGVRFVEEWSDGQELKEAKDNLKMMDL